MTTDILTGMVRGSGKMPPNIFYHRRQQANALEKFNV
jgi:hypothetical protein